VKPLVLLRIVLAFVQLLDRIREEPELIDLQIPDLGGRPLQALGDEERVGQDS
jgi:hypothetical protein